MLSEHTLEGWLEGYLLTGRHGFLSSYEAFVHVIDSMFNMHAKWLASSLEQKWRAPISSLNLLITSTVWRQDHNGFTHQDPGFLDLVVNKSPEVCRIRSRIVISRLASTVSSPLPAWTRSPLNSGRYLETGSSSLSLPSSAKIRAATVVIGLVME